MSLPDASEFKQLYLTDTATDLDDAQIEQCLNRAKSKLISLVGASAVAAVETIEDEVYSAAEQDIRTAHGLLGLRHALLIGSNRINNGGIVESGTDSTGAGTRWESFANTQKRRAEILQEVLDLLEAQIAAGAITTIAPAKTTARAIEYYF